MIIRIIDCEVEIINEHTCRYVCEQCTCFMHSYCIRTICDYNTCKYRFLTIELLHSL